MKKKPVLTLIASTALSLTACSTTASSGGATHGSHHHGSGTHAPETRTVGTVNLQLRPVLATPVKRSATGALPASTCSDAADLDKTTTLCSGEGRRYLVGPATTLCCVESAHLMAGTTSTTGAPVHDWMVMVTLTPQGAKDFKAITEDAHRANGYVGLTMGKDILVAPTVASDIQDRQMSIGSLTEPQARALFSAVTKAADTD